MASSTGSGSDGGRAPRSSRPSSSSQSPAPSGDSARQAIEPRRDLAVPLPVELVRGDGARSREYAVNLSPGGIGLHLPQPLAVGEAIEVVFELPPDGRAIRARGRVIWCEETGAASALRGAPFRETGVRFEGLGEADREAIRRFVRPGSAEGPNGR